jgi:hypothetical protein
MPKSKIVFFINSTKKYVIYKFATAYQFIKVTIPGTLCSTINIGMSLNKVETSKKIKTRSVFDVRLEKVCPLF